MSPKNGTAPADQPVSVLPHPLLKQAAKGQPRRRDSKPDEPPVTVLQRWLDLSA
jgi:hypothetical protein